MYLRHCKKIKMSASFRQFIVLICLSTFASTFGWAQQLKISVSDNNRQPLVGATVSLTNASDSTVNHMITDYSGNAVFENIKNDLYHVQISYIGYQPLDKTISVKAEKRNFDFKLTDKAIDLEGVTITAKKPLITQEDDKMIIDPEPIASISTNTLEVLESTPGLYVDQDGGIYLSSTTPAAVYINGRELKMSNQDISDLLRSLPPNSVQRIEVMRTPSTKYDASSSGGIINIVLKKGVKLGRFGSVNSGMNKGEYANGFIGASLNSSGDKSTFYINANANINNRLEEINSVRFLTSDTLLHQHAESIQKSKQGFIGYGVSYDFNENVLFNYDGRVNYSFRKTESVNDNTVNDINEFIISNSTNTINSTTEFLSIQQDFGMILKFDTIGSQLDTKLSYSFSGNNSIQNYSTNYTIPIELLYSGKGKNIQNRHFIVFQSDLLYHLPYGFKTETGIKSSIQLYDSQADFLIGQNDIYIPDENRTNAYNYQERISAAYVQISRKLWLDILLKTGIRMEHTYMKGIQTIPIDTSFIVNRADFFPYIYLSRRVIKIMGIELFGYMIYRRTINRPGYQDLNPYVKLVDEFLYETGNPELTPQFTDNIELNISFDDMPIFAIGRNYTTDIYSMVVYQDEQFENVAVRTYDNIGNSRETYLRFMGGIPPGGMYFFALGGQYNFNEYDGIYENEPLLYNRDSWRFFTFHSLKLFKYTKLTLSGFYMINGNYNFYELNNFGQLNAGITQTLFNQKLSISLNFRDIFKTMITEFTFNQGSVNSYGDRYTDNRRIGIHIRYNFGISKKDDKKNMPGFDFEE